MQVIFSPRENGWWSVHLTQPPVSFQFSLLGDCTHNNIVTYWTGSISVSVCCDWALGKTAYALSVCPSSVPVWFLAQHVYVFLLLLPTWDSLGATLQDHFDGSLYLVIIFSAVTMKLNTSSHSLLSICMSFLIFFIAVAHLGFTWCYITRWFWRQHLPGNCFLHHRHEAQYQFYSLLNMCMSFLLLLPTSDSLGATSHFDCNLYLVIVSSAGAMKLGGIGCQQHVHGRDGQSADGRSPLCGLHDQLLRQWRGLLQPLQICPPHSAQAHPAGHFGVGLWMAPEQAGHPPGWWGEVGVGGVEGGGATGQVTPLVRAGMLLIRLGVWGVQYYDPFFF